MDAQEVLGYLVAYMDYNYGPENFNSQPVYYTPRFVGAFGATQTDRYSQSVMINGVRYTFTVERDPNQ